MKQGKSNTNPKTKTASNVPPAPPSGLQHLQQDAQSKGKYITWVHFGILAVIYLILFVTCYSDKINLGGDNIYYHTLGKALATGQGYTEIISPTATPNNHFPPGYPFIISLFMRLGFEDISFYYVLNGILGFLSIVMLYKLIVRLDFSKRLAFVVCFFVAINTGYISFAIGNMSEIPYLLFSLLAFYLLAGIDFTKKLYLDVHFLLMTALVIATYYIRSSGITLVVAIAIVLLVRKKWLHALTFLGAFVLCILPWQMRSSRLGGNGYIKQLLSKNPYAPELGKATASDFIDRAWINIQRYLNTEIPSSINGKLFETTAPTTMDWLFGFIVLFLVLYALVKLIKSIKMLPVLLYVVLTAGMLSLWPDKWVGIRFMLPIVPLMLFLVIYSINAILEGVGGKMKFNWNIYVLCIASIFFITPIRTLSKVQQEPYPPGYQNYFAIAEWAKENTPENSIVCCRKPELFYLFSDRKCVKYPFSLDPDSVLHSLEADKVDFVVVEQLGYSSTYKYLIPAINKYGKRFKVIRKLEAPETYFIKFNKDGTENPTSVVPGQAPAQAPANAPQGANTPAPAAAPPATPAPPANGVKK